MSGLIKNLGSAKALVTTLVLLGSFSVYSQQGGVEQSNEAVLNSALININGYVKEKPEATDSELEYLKQEITKQQNELEINKDKEKGYKELQKTTEKLVDATADYLEEKRESQKSIDAYNEKIKCLMDENRDPKECDDIGRERKDSISVVQSAPVVQAAAHKEDSYDDNSVRVIPFAGVTSYSAEGFVNMDSTSNMGVRAESDVTDRITVGVGFETLEIKSIGMQPTTYSSIIGLNPFDTLTYKSNALEVYGKYNLINKKRFKVYGGLGLAYNRSKQTVNRFSQFGIPAPTFFGDTTTLDSNFLSGKAMVGSSFNFGSNWGASLDVAYGRGLRNNTNSQYYAGPYQRLLQEFARKIQRADAVSIQAGVSYSF